MARNFGTPAILPADPQAPLWAATKQYTDGLGAHWLPVAGRAIVPNENTSFTNAGLQWATAARYSRTVHRVLQGGASQVRLEYANWGNQNGDSTAAVGGSPSIGARPYEVSNPNAVSFRASIEYPAGVWRQTTGSTAWSSATAYVVGDQVTNGGNTWVALAGSTNVTPVAGATWAQVTRYLVHWYNEDATRAVGVTGGVTIASLPVVIPNLTPGMFLAVNSMVLTGSSTNKFTAGDVSRSKDFAVDYATTPPTAGSGTDPVDSGVTTQTTAAAGTPIPLPLMVAGIGAGNSAVALIGDSIVYGLQDSDTTWGYLRGMFAAALEDSQTPHIRLAQSGSEALQFLAVNAPLRLAVAARCTAAICDLGVNDITLQSGVTANVQAQLVALWQALDQRGIQVWQTTVMPSTTSTDSFATKVNQSVNGAFNTCRQAVNAWLRGGATYTINGQSVSVGNPLHPLTGVMDFSPYVEDPGDNTRWLTNGSGSFWTPDGIHPSQAAYASLAGQVVLFVRRLVALGSPYPFTAAQVGAVDLKFMSYLFSYGGPQDASIYGDVLSSLPRYQATTLVTTAQTASTTRTHYAWLGTPGVTTTFNNVKIYVGNTNATALVCGVYVGPTNTSLTQQATATVATPTTTGEKVTALSNSVTVQPGQYVVVEVAITIGVTTGGVLAGSAPGTLDPGGLTQAGYLTANGGLPAGTINLGSGYTAQGSKIWAALS